jgi:hypothetical protein
MHSVKTFVNEMPTSDFLNNIAKINKITFLLQLSRWNPRYQDHKGYIASGRKRRWGGGTSIIDSLASTPDFVILSPSPCFGDIRTSWLIIEFGNLLIKQ